MKSLCRENKERVLELTEGVSHLMALTIDHGQKGNKIFDKEIEGIVRCIISRDGDVAKHGYIDRSELRFVKGTDLYRFDLGDRLIFQSEEEILTTLMPSGYECIGYEDPDIVYGEDGLVHLYFTIPLLHTKTTKMHIYLGHAVGPDIHHLTMTTPLIKNDKMTAKEISIAPINKKGFHNNLFESSDFIKGAHYTTVSVCSMKEIGNSAQVGSIVVHPFFEKKAWMGGHASPGPLLPHSFLKLRDGILVGLLNGREANTKVNGETYYGVFSVGLFLYDYENGKVLWIDDEPLIVDSEARTITFASHFIDKGNGEGIIYAHVDDSFVRAYDVKSEDIQKRVEEKYLF